MHFGERIVLYGLFAVPFLALFYLWVFHRKRKMLSRIGEWRLIRHLTNSVSTRKQKLKAILIVVAAALLIFTLSRPQYGSIERPVVRKGVDIFIAIDTSLSMLARDIKPTRLDRAKEQLKGLVHRLKSDRVGIITFAGTAFVQCPLTMDYGLALDILDTIDHESVPVEGTAIGEAVRAARKAFERSGKGERVLVLLTDGEDQETDPIGAAREAEEAGIKIYSIGIGSQKGEPIRLPDGSLKRDSEGHIVNSKLDLGLLKEISRITGGKTLVANPKGGLELDAVYKDIGLMEKETLRSRTYSIYEERFQYFLLPVIILLIIEMILSDRKKRKRISSAAMLILIFPLITGFTLKDHLAENNQLGNAAYQKGNYEKALEHYRNALEKKPENTESPRLHFNMGNALYRQKKYEEAIKEYQKAAALFENEETRADSMYNIGASRYRMAENLVSQKKMQEALDQLEQSMNANKEAMKNNPGDQDPKYNYQQAKKLYEKIKQQMQQQKQQQKQQQDQDKKKQEDQKDKKQQKQDKKEEEKKQQQQESKEDQKKKDQPQKEQEQKEQEQQKQQKEQQKKQQQQDQKQKKEEQEQAQKQPQARIGEMSREDARRLLQMLPKDNREALKKALKRQYRGRTGTKQDW